MKKHAIILGLLIGLILGFYKPNIVKSSIVTIPLNPNDKKITDFPSVGNIVASTKNKDGITETYLGSGQPIGDGTWIITARHVVAKLESNKYVPFKPEDITFSIPSRNFPNSPNVYEVFYATKVVIHDNADVALIKLNRPVDNAFLLYDKENSLINKIFYGVGYGKKVTSIKDKQFVLDTEIFTEKRVFKNTVDSIFSVVLEEIDGKVSRSKDYPISYLYTLSDASTLYKDNGAILGEGLSTPGDSGGGIFIEENGILYLTGIQIEINIQRTPEIGIFVELFSIKKWIESIIYDQSINQPKNK